MRYKSTYWTPSWTMFVDKRTQAMSVGRRCDTRLLQALLERLRNAELVPPRELGRNIEIFPSQAALANAFSGLLFVLVTLGSV